MNTLIVPTYLEEAFGDSYTHADTEKTLYSFYSVNIGLLNIVEGKIVACDPFLYNDDKPFDTTFPVGPFPVELAIAKINTDERVGFSRIKFSNKSPSRWSMAVTPEQDLSNLDPKDIYGYGVDSGTGCYMDSSGAKQYSDFLASAEDNYIKVIDEMEETYKDTRSWLLWDKNGFNVAMFSTGWGDGLYATYIGFDTNGNICRLVTDFGLLDWPE